MTEDEMLGGIGGKRRRGQQRMRCWEGLGAGEGGRWLRISPQREMRLAG